MKKPLMITKSVFLFTLLFSLTALAQMSTIASVATGGDSAMVRRGEPKMLHGAPAKYMMLNRTQGDSPERPFQKYGSISLPPSIKPGHVTSLSGEDNRHATADSAFWQQTNGPHGVDILALAINSSGYIFAGTDSGGLCLSTDNGTSWTQDSLTNSEVLSLAINSSGYIFAGTDGGGIYLSTNNGTSWTQENNGLTNSVVLSLAINSSGYIFAGTYGGGVYLSTNNGTSWTQENDGLTNSYVYSLAINSTGYIFAGTFSGEVYLSTDNGTSWTQGGMTNSLVCSLAINASGYIFAGMNGGVYLSTNNGTSWTQDGLTKSEVLSSTINSSGYIFAGTYDGGVYLSTNNGASWTQENNGLTNRYVYSLAINSTGYIFAGTYGGGVFRSTKSTVTSVQKTSSHVLVSYGLFQNYPNPFNPATVIRYDIPKLSRVTLVVYDILGREVKTLVDEAKSAGSYTVRFHASTLPSGVYFYRLSAGSLTGEAGAYHDTKKLLILK